MFFSPRNLTSRPHHASSPRNTELAHIIHDKWKEYGFDVKLVKYNVLLSFPEKGQVNGASLLNDSNNVIFETAKQEKILDPLENFTDALPPFSAYSPSGIATVSFELSTFRWVCNVTVKNDLVEDLDKISQDLVLQ